MVITLSDYPDVVNNINVEWNKATTEFDVVRDKLAVVKHGDTRYITDHSHFSSVQTARRRTDGGNAQKTDVKQGYRVTLTKDEIGMEIDVTKRMRRYDGMGAIMNEVRKIRDGAQRRCELDITSLVNNAWSSSYTNLDGESVTTTAPDGNPLMYSAHTSRGSSNTYNNQVGSVGATHDPFSPTVLEALEEAGNRLNDEADGRNVPTQFDTIITGRHAPTVNAVERTLNSLMYPGSSTADTNRANNNLKGRYQHLILPFLDIDPATEGVDSSKYRYTFLANLRNEDRNGFYMTFSQDVMLDEGESQITESGIWQWVVTADYAFGLTASNFVVGTKGDGTVIA